MNVCSEPSRISKSLAKLCRWICIVITGVLVALVIAQVFMRFVLNMGAPWIEEVCMIAMMWIAFFGGSLVFYQQSGISVTFLVERLSPCNYRRCQIFFHLLTILFFLFLMIYGMQFALLGQRMVFGASGISKFWAYLSIPVGALLSILFEGDHLIRQIRSKAPISNHVYGQPEEEVSE